MNFDVPAGVVAATARLWRPLLFYIHQRTTAKLPLVNIFKTQSAMVFNTSSISISLLPMAGQLFWPAVGTASRNVPAMVDEEKRDSADSKQDATTQAAFSMRRAWFDDDVGFLYLL